jgi:hypothetical protein
MSVAAVPCELPSTGVASVSMIVLGCFAIAVGLVLTRLPIRKDRLPLTMLLVLVAAICATAPRSASASAADCSQSTLDFAWPDFHWRPPSEPVCDKLQRFIDGGIEYFPNIGINVNTGSGDGTYFGYSTDANDPTYFENPTAWLDGFTPNEFSYEWQTLNDGVWEAAPWDTGTNPLQVEGSTPLLETISGALFTRTGRLFIRASDGTIDQGCDVYLTELPG